jgi:NADH-quinone oxidoreductase subunit J
MALIVTMLFLAGIYGLLGMHFVAAFQVLIYVGAVMLFMVYVIMLLEAREATGRRYSRLLVPGAAGLVALLFVLAASVWRPLPSPVAELGAAGYGIAAFSADFLGPYWLLFELTSVLLVAAVVAALAAIRIARRPGEGNRHG